MVCHGRQDQRYDIQVQNWRGVLSSFRDTVKWSETTFYLLQDGQQRKNTDDILDTALRFVGM